jgi:cupin superfamily acireductone dioxygenase involved in methionine salvage
MTKELVKIYPNPATDHLYIEGSGQEVSIFDLLGKKVLEQKMDATATKISLPRLPSGTYHVVVRTAQQQMVAMRIFIGGWDKD